MTLGHTIKKIRLSKKLTQRKLAQTAGITPSALSYMEAGKGETKIQTLRNIADAFNMKVWEILKESDI